MNYTHLSRIGAIAALAGTSLLAAPAFGQTPPAPPGQPAPVTPTTPAQPSATTAPPAITMPPATTPSTPRPNMCMSSVTNAGAQCANMMNVNRTTMKRRNMLTNNPNGSNWLAAFNRPNVIAKNRRQYRSSRVGRGQPPR